MAFGGSENTQKGQRSAQYSVPPLKIQRGRVRIPGDFSVLEVRIAEGVNDLPPYNWSRRGYTATDPPGHPRCRPRYIGILA